MTSKSHVAATGMLSEVHDLIMTYSIKPVTRGNHTGVDPLVDNNACEIFLPARNSACRRAEYKSVHAVSLMDTNVNVIKNARHSAFRFMAGHKLVRRSAPFVLCS